jgi:hypothetical protein
VGVPSVGVGVASVGPDSGGDATVDGLGFGMGFAVGRGVGAGRHDETPLPEARAAVGAGAA